MIVEELIKTYDGKPVVDSVSFSLPKGKVTSLIGPNGAGKSTVMGMISRLIARDGGLVEFEGQDIGKWKSKELSKRLAILTQSNHIQMKLTVEELVAFGRFPYSGGRLTEEDKKKYTDYQVSAEDYYCEVIKQENTVLYVTAYHDYESEAKQIVSELGYK